MPESTRNLKKEQQRQEEIKGHERLADHVAQPKNESTGNDPSNILKPHPIDLGSGADPKVKQQSTPSGENLDPNKMDPKLRKRLENKLKQKPGAAATPKASPLK